MKITTNHVAVGLGLVLVAGALYMLLRPAPLPQTSPAWLGAYGPPPDTQFQTLDQINPLLRKISPATGTGSWLTGGPIRDRSYPASYTPLGGAPSA